MNMDFVFPNDNEEELLEAAASFGYSGICFCYRYGADLIKKNLSAKLKNLKAEENPKLKVYSALLVEEKSLQKLNKKEFDFVILKANKNLQNTLTRFSRKIDFVYGSEFISGNDSLHSRKSGVNHVVCNLMKENNISMVVSLKDLICSMHLDPKKFAQLLGRISQNIILARKYKLNLKFVSFAEDKYGMRSRHDMIALLIVLGMHPKEAKDALSL